ncbi:hypothetical protein CEXT_351731 [Caerostris extrusa]|uniref:Uncharacterized protein n=1 Tax=Caerostris extrusa TaxID=172846 RepID=A0AAV4V8Z0_CAEEX|nr:hypothetical protein CEXT_351731 [Caerostris extrusa]
MRKVTPSPDRTEAPEKILLFLPWRPSTLSPLPGGRAKNSCSRPHLRSPRPGHLLPAHLPHFPPWWEGGFSLSREQCRENC